MSTNKIMLDGKEVKVGDKLWSFIFGWGIVQSTENNYRLPLLVKFSVPVRVYSSEGKLNDEYARDLFWDELKYEIPKPPKRKVKKYLYAYSYRTTLGEVYNHLTLKKYSPEEFAKIPCEVYTRLDWSEEEFEEEV